MPQSSRPNSLEQRADNTAALESRYRRRWFVATILMLATRPLIGFGAHQTMHSMLTLPSRWLPESFPERRALEQFVDEFESGDSVLISWPGCSVDDPRLAEIQSAIEALRDDPDRPVEAGYFDETSSGYSALQELTRPPLSLSRDEALLRLRGALVGNDGVFSCVVIALTEKGLYERDAVLPVILREAERVTGIDREKFLLAGAPVEGAFLDAEATFDANLLSIPSTIVSALLCWWCLRSWRYTAVVLATALFGQGLVLAAMHWCGVRMNALLIVLPTLVLVLTVSAGVHLVNYYYDAVRRFGVTGAAERALNAGRRPCILAVVTTAMGMLSLCVSDIEPIVQFGILAAAGVLLTVGLLLYVLPGAFAKWPAAVPDGDDIDEAPMSQPPARRWDRILDAYAAWIHRHALLIGFLFLAGTVVAGIGLRNVKSSIAFDSLFPAKSRISRDYSILEQDLGPLVPVEVLVHFANDNELPFRQRLDVVRRAEQALHNVPHVGGSLSAATFAPNFKADPQDMEQAIALFRRLQLPIGGGAPAELAAMQAAPAGTHHAAVAFSRPAAPINVVSMHHSTFREGASFADVPSDVSRNRRPQHTIAAVVAFASGPSATQAMPVLPVLDDSGSVPLPTYEVPPPELVESRAIAAAERDVRETLIRRNLLHETADRQSWRISARVPAMEGLDYHESLSQLQHAVEPILQDANDGESPTISAEYTGVMPVVSQTQRVLLHDLYVSFLTAFGLVAMVMVFVLGTIRAALIAMLPNVFPAVVAFGAMGWAELPVDIGTMMTASVALGIAVDDTLHFLTWYRIETSRGRDRAEAVRLCFRHCARAMMQTTLICGTGMLVFAFSGFVPTARFAWLMFALLATTLAGDLVFLPALLNSFAGRCFGNAPRQAEG